MTVTLCRSACYLDPPQARSFLTYVNRFLIFLNRNRPSTSFGLNNTLTPTGYPLKVVSYLESTMALNFRKLFIHSRCSENYLGRCALYTLLLAMPWKLIRNLFLVLEDCQCHIHDDLEILVTPRPGTNNYSMPLNRPRGRIPKDKRFPSSNLDSWLQRLHLRVFWKLILTRLFRIG